MKWLKEKDTMGVERYLYILFWFSAGVAGFCYALPPLAMIFGW